ncbi:hypothetical protein CDAR_114901, partial [Caerostris darwini]
MAPSSATPTGQTQPQATSKQVKRKTPSTTDAEGFITPSRRWTRKNSAPTLFLILS